MEWLAVTQPYSILRQGDAVPSSNGKIRTVVSVIYIRWTH